MVTLTKLNSSDPNADVWQVRHGALDTTTPVIGYFDSYKAAQLRFEEYKSMDEYYAYQQNWRADHNRGIK